MGLTLLQNQRQKLKLREKEIVKLLREGKKYFIEDIFLLVYLPNKIGQRRFAVIASKKIGKAVKRNRAKRLLRELFRRNLTLFPTSYDYLLIASPKILNFKYPELAERAIPILKKVLTSLPLSFYESSG